MGGRKGLVLAKRVRTVGKETRRDRTIQEARHDVYQERWKPREPTACPRCGAVFHKGRWNWGVPAAEAHRSLCPACERMQDHNPAGEVRVRGPFVRAHRDEILGLVHNEEARAKAEHPLSRLMRIVEDKGAVVVTTTDVHLPRRIGEALRHAYQGRLAIRYSKEQEYLRIAWVR